MTPDYCDKCGSEVERIAKRSTITGGTTLVTYDVGGDYHWLRCRHNGQINLSPSYEDIQRARGAKIKPPRKPSPDAMRRLSQSGGKKTAATMEIP